MNVTNGNGKRFSEMVISGRSFEDESPPRCRWTDAAQRKGIACAEGRRLALAVLAAPEDEAAGAAYHDHVEACTAAPALRIFEVDVDGAYLYRAAAHDEDEAVHVVDDSLEHDPDLMGEDEETTAKLHAAFPDGSYAYSLRAHLAEEQPEKPPQGSARVLDWSAYNSWRPSWPESFDPDAPAAAGGPRP